MPDLKRVVVSLPVSIAYFKDEDGRIYLQDVEVPGERSCVLAIEAMADTDEE